jgi:rhodanese-related sulfurtransferase
MAWLMGLARITPADLLALIEQKSVTVCDVNDAARWGEGHVPGARNLVHDQFGAESLPPDKQASLVFYCSNPMCRKAPIAARRALKFGFTDVRVLAAGISGWRDAGLPVEAG